MKKAGTILYIEDNAVSTVLMDMIVQQLGDFVMVSTITAEEGFAIACEIKPVLFLIDINLPGISGIEFMRRIRNLKEFEHTPMIAVSALDEEEIVEDALAAGCSTYIHKPIDVQEMATVICECLELPAPELDTGLLPS